MTAQGGPETRLRFGDRVTNTVASDNNPQKHGTFVRYVVRRGQMNPGRWAECTDGDGTFWESNPANLVPTPTEGEPERCQSDHEDLVDAGAEFRKGQSEGEPATEGSLKWVDGRFVARYPPAPTVAGDARDIVVVHVTEDAGPPTCTSKMTMAEAVKFYDWITEREVGQGGAMVCRVLHDHMSQFPAEQLVAGDAETEDGPAEFVMQLRGGRTVLYRKVLGLDRPTEEDLAEIRARLRSTPEADEKRPDAVMIETWRYPDSDEPDEATYMIDTDDVEAERLLAVKDDVKYLSLPPHRLTSRLVYYGPRHEHKFEVRTPATPPETGDEP